MERIFMNYSEKDLKETSTPDLFLPMLLAKREELLAIIDSKRKALMRAPQGRLRIAVKRGTPQWFHVSEAQTKTSAVGDVAKLETEALNMSAGRSISGEHANEQMKMNPQKSLSRKPLLNRAAQRGTYLPQTEEKLARRLAQKSYDEKVLETARKSLAAIEAFLNVYEKNSVNEVAGKMHEARQTLLRPVMLSDQVLAARWQAIPYEGKDFGEGTVMLATTRGELVRSKSEVIIANTLHSLNIPYRYEFPHKFGRMIFHPDFTCLNLRTRQTFIWEHFGLVEDVGYAKNMVSKTELFARNCFLPGINLITTSETLDSPLDSELVQLYAERYLL